MGKSLDDLMPERPGDPERQAEHMAWMLREIQEKRAARLIIATSADIEADLYGDWP